MADWHYRMGDTNVGPLSGKELKALVDAGRVLADDLVWKDGMKDWVRAGEVRGLFPPPESTHGQQQSTKNQAERIPTGRDSVNEQSVAAALLDTARAAASLAATQAERTKLATITLQSAYKSYGEACYRSGEFRKEFGDLHERIDLLEREAVAPSSTPTPASSFIDKTKAVARRAVEQAKTAKGKVQQAIFLAQLGKAVFEKHSGASGTAEAANQLRTITSRISQLDEEIAALDLVGREKLSISKKLLIGFIVCVLVVGVIGAAIEKRSKKSANASHSKLVAQLPDFSKVDYTKGPNGEKPKPFTLSMVRNGRKFAEVDKLNGAKGLTVMGNAIDLPDGRSAYHGRIAWQSTLDNLDNPVLLDVAISMILHGRGEVTFNAGRPHGLLTCWHESGQKWIEIPYVEGRRHGTAHAWHSNGAKQFDLLFVDDLRQGEVVEFYSDGTKMEEGAFSDDLRDGTWTMWERHDGEAHQLFEGKYVKGKEVGVHRKWYVAGGGGNLQSETPFVDGKEHGVERGWWPAASAGRPMIPMFTRTWNQGEAVDAKNFPRPF